MAELTPQGGLAAAPSAATEESKDSTNIGTGKAAPIKIGKYIRTYRSCVYYEQTKANRLNRTNQ